MSQRREFKYHCELCGRTRVETPGKTKAARPDCKKCKVRMQPEMAVIYTARGSRPIPDQCKSSPGQTFLFGHDEHVDAS